MRCGVLRAKDDVTYTVPNTIGAVQVVVRNDQGDDIYTSELAVSDYGTFDGSITLDSEASLGYYVIEITAGPDYARTRGFQVAEYRAPEFLVEVTSKQDEVLAGDQISVTVDAQFFFGGAVSGLTAEPDSLPVLGDGEAPSNFEQMWAGFDPRAEPLDIEILKEWEEDGVVM